MQLIKTHWFALIINSDIDGCLLIVHSTPLACGSRVLQTKVVLHRPNQFYFHICCKMLTFHVVILTLDVAYILIII